MKKILTSFFILAFCYHSFAQQKYQVKDGETINDISKAQLVNPKEILDLNPSIVNNNGAIKKGETILIPSKVDNDQFLIHETKRRDNLYRISKKYNLDQKDIFTANPGLDLIGLKKGMQLRIPKNNSKPKTFKVNLDETKVAKTTHTIIKGDNLYRLGKKYNLTMDEIYILNPQLLDGGLKEGMVLNIKTQLENIPKPKYDNTKFKVHQIKKKENLYRIALLYDTTITAIKNINTGLNESNLKLGEYILIPNSSTNVASRKSSTYAVNPNYFNTVVDKNTIYDVAIVLNFGAHKYQGIKSKQGNVTRFYMGAKQALNQLAAKGMKLNVHVFDTKGNSPEIKRISELGFVKNADLIIAPWETDPAKYFAIKNPKAVVVSSISRTQDLTNLPNLVRVGTSSKDLLKTLTNTVKAEYNTSDKIIILSSGSSKEEAYVNFFYDNLIENGIPAADIAIKLELDKMAVDKQNYKVIIASKSKKVAEKAVSYFTKNQNVTAKIYGIYNYRLESKFSTSKLKKVHYSYITGFKLDHHLLNDFTARYVKTNKNKPDYYSYLGYDVTYDLLLRLSTNQFYNSLTSRESKRIGMKFNFKKLSNGGYYNEGGIFKRYQPNPIVKAIDKSLKIIN